MSVYYDDLVLAGTAYRGQSYGQNDSGYADDTLYVPVFIASEVEPEPEHPQPEAAILGPGRSKPMRFVTKHKGDYWSFATIEQLQEFLKQNEDKPKKKQKKRNTLRVEVQPEFQDELYQYDLPQIQPYLDQRKFDELNQIMAQFEMARQVMAVQSQREMQIRKDDEEVLLLIA